VPYGVIFASFMVMILAGSAVFTMLSRVYSLYNIATGTFIAASLALLIPVVYSWVRRRHVDAVGDWELLLDLTLFALLLVGPHGTHVELLSVRALLRRLLPVHELVASADCSEPNASHNHEPLPRAAQHLGAVCTHQCTIASNSPRRSHGSCEACISRSFMCLLQIENFSAPVMFFICSAWLAFAVILMRILSQQNEHQPTRQEQQQKQDQHQQHHKLKSSTRSDMDGDVHNATTPSDNASDLELDSTSDNISDSDVATTIDDSQSKSPQHTVAAAQSS